ncbi:MAG: YggS family pyridoxal phosphate-dependent enzyme [Desulfobulbaceae bacterium]|nr:YggS family pyridoxal phosphate-dependent enzyme [Desulfobulbaceae bacterium]
MSSPQNRLAEVRERISLAARRSGRQACDITLVAVSKRVTVLSLQETIAAGQGVFGENYLQEAAEKIAALPAVTWHFIGGLQSNKARQVAELFQVVETVDRIKIAQALENQLVALEKSLQVYVQVNIGREGQKSGVLPEHVEALVAGIKACPHLVLAGLMAMPPYHPDPEASRPFFRQMKGLADDLLRRGVVSRPLGLSMGMSADFEIAIEEGATVVRVGTALFGERV